jgi:hypothetical protein
MIAAPVATVRAKTPASSSHRSPYLPPVIRPARRQDADSTDLTARKAAPKTSWNFGAIPIFPPDRTSQAAPTAPRRTPSLPGVLQAKLAVREIDDPLEHEADRVAEQVMRMPAPEVAPTAAPPQISRKSAACDEGTEKLRRKEAGTAEASLSEAPTSVHEALRSPARPLDISTRAYFEPRFGQEFGNVRVHTGMMAARSARDVDAHAYTVGQDIIFGAGQFAPGTRAGRRLIAHELTHVIQQERASELRLDNSTARNAPGALQRAPRRPAGHEEKGLPPVRVQLDESRWGGGWLLEFDSWVTRAELVRALFRSGGLPAGVSIEPTRQGDKGDFISLYWTLRPEGQIERNIGELTAYGEQLRQRAHGSGRGEEFEEEQWWREAAEGRARAATEEHNKTFVPALGMTGAEALRTMKPGLYLAAPGLPRLSVPRLVWRDKRPDVSFVRSYYLYGGVFVLVSLAGRIQIRELGHPADEDFWATMIWFMQQGDDLEGAEQHYIRLMEELNRTKIAAMAMAYTTAPSFGPRANVVEAALSLAGPGRTAGKDVRLLSQVDPIEAVRVGLNAYSVVQTDVDVIKGARERAEAEAKANEAQAAHERGDLFQLPVLVAEDAAVNADPAPRPEPGSAPLSLQRAPAAKGTGATASKRPLPTRERVDGFIKELTDEYRDDIAVARKKYWADTASVIGTEAEKMTLGKVARLARRWGLDPNRIWAGDVPVGVAGAKGGVITVEIASTYYKFMVELKKSPFAVRDYQAEAHLVAIEKGINFPGGGRYFRIYGELFGRGRGVYVHETAPPPKVKPPRRR